MAPTVIKPLALLVLIFVCVVPPVDNALPVNPTQIVSPFSVYAESEDLVYEVSWAFVKIGTVHIKTLGTFKAIAYIDSYENLPFVDLHSVHYAEMDSAFCSKGGYAIDKDGTEWRGLHYAPSPTARNVIIDQLYQKDASSSPYRRVPQDTLLLPSREFVDGLSIGYFPRLLLRSMQTVNITTLLKGKIGTTTFHFTNNRTTEGIGALDEPVRVVEVEGTTDAVGVYGMTGDFTGWFSDDAAAVPIKGKLKVLLGNITIELVKWNRQNWTPPI